MGIIHDLKQKAEGKVDQLKGEMNEEQGRGAKGGMQKIKGKAKEKMADMKMRAREERSTKDEL